MIYGLHLWTDRITTTQPGDAWPSSTPGAVHAGVLIPVPVWLARLWCWGRAR